jgi:DNA-binding LacI/PurR family transcriptional regulator
MVVHSIEARAYELGYNILLSNSSENIDKEESQIERFRGMGVEGLIIASLSLQYRATTLIRKVHDDGFPYVMVSYIHDPDYWYVGSDHEHGGFVAAEHLIKCGYTSIGYVHPGKGNLLSEVRKNGSSRALIENEIPFNSDLIYYPAGEEQVLTLDRFQIGYDFAKRFVGFNIRPRALFFYNDMLALGFIQGATEAGLSVPEDVAVVGFDDTAVGRYASVPLTTIHQPVDKIGRLAVETVQKRITKTDTGSRIVLKPTLVIRESCGARRLTGQPPSQDPR